MAHLSIKQSQHALKSILSLIEKQSSFQLTKDQTDLLLKLAFEWPDEYRFPGIDLLCTVIVFSPSSNVLYPELLDSILSRMQFSDSMNKTKQINAMLEIRFLCNASSGFADLIFSRLESILSILSMAYKAPPNKNLRIAIATWMLKYVIKFRMNISYF